MSSFMKWRTRDGRDVAISDMDDSHLVNTFAYVRDKFRELAGIDWFPGVSGHRNSALRIANFAKAFYAECMKRKLDWNRGYLKDAADSLFVPAQALTKPPAHRWNKLVGMKLSINLDDD